MKNTVILLALALVAPMAFAQEQKQATAPAAQAAADAKAPGYTRKPYAGVVTPPRQNAAEGEIEYRGQKHGLLFSDTRDSKYTHPQDPHTKYTTNWFVQKGVQIPDPRQEISITESTVLDGSDPKAIARKEFDNFSGKGFMTIRNTDDPNNLSAGRLYGGGTGDFEVRNCTVEGCKVRETVVYGHMDMSKGDLKERLQAEIEKAQALQGVKLKGPQPVEQ